MEIDLATTIRQRTEDLIYYKDAIVLGQCLTAVGWVGGTIPQLVNHPNIVELSMADVAGGGFAVGAALDDDRPVIYVVRYQGFLWYNAISIANYAAKSFELFGVPCPIIVRAIAMEGAIGPVAGNYHLSMLLRMPGINIFAPMTPNEWNFALDFHLKEFTKPTVIGEHRLAFPIVGELQDLIKTDSKITILSIGSARLNAVKAHEMLEQDGISVDLFHLFRLQPLAWPEGLLQSISRTGICLVVDSDYSDWGPSENLCFKLSKLVESKNEVLGIPRKSAGFSPQTDNLAPSPRQIFESVKNLLI
jgi:pyruvate/2-oxoglutarate/acetoin dehydrogenase E1 component